jgi:hypothetical protein
MMLFLSVDILDQCGQMRWANRKTSVSALPRETRVFWRLRFDPLGGGDLEFFDEVALRNRTSQACGDVNVIGSAANAIRLATQVPANHGEVSEKIRSNIPVDPCFAVLCTEDEMKDNLAERLGHGIRSDEARLQRASSYIT